MKEQGKKKGREGLGLTTKLNSHGSITYLHSLVTQIFKYSKFVVKEPYF